METKEILAFMQDKPISKDVKDLKVCSDLEKIIEYYNSYVQLINVLPLEPYYKVVTSAQFIKYADKVNRLKNLQVLIDDISIQQAEIVYKRNKIPAVLNYKKQNNILNQYILEYESLVATSEHLEKQAETSKDEDIEFKPNSLGFKIRKHTESLKSGQDLQQLRTDLRSVLSHLIVVQNDAVNDALSVVEGNDYYKKCVNDYNGLKSQKAELRREQNNLKRSLTDLRVSKKCVLFSSEERDSTGNINISGVQWISETYKSKRIITY